MCIQKINTKPRNKKPSPKGRTYRMGLNIQKTRYQWTSPTYGGSIVGFEAWKYNLDLAQIRNGLK